MKTKPLTFLLTLILSFTCLTGNSFGFSERDLRQLLETGNCINCDLSGAYLSRRDLSGAELSWANLKGARLEGANLTQAKLRKANLEETEWSRTDLRYANLSGADLSGANLTGANLCKTNLTGAILTGTIGFSSEKDFCLENKEIRLAEVKRQKEFLNIISTYAEKYTNTKNEMKKSLQRKKRVKAFKKFFSGGLGFEYWVGTITSVDTDKDGDADVSIDIGGITLNNVAKKIKLSDDLFDKVAEMEVEDKVVIRGSFLKHDELLTSGWYLYTMNPTEKGGMTVPLFSVLYFDITKVKTETVEQGASKCSAETDSLQRLTCYDNLPENLKGEQCSSTSDSLKRLSCFDNQKS